jgi:hypothetical protein
MHPFCFLDPVALVISTLVRLQADYSLRANVRVMDSAGGQVEAVAGFQVQLLAKLRQAKGDTAAHHIDDFIVRM